MFRMMKKDITVKLKRNHYLQSTILTEYFDFDHTTTTGNPFSGIKPYDEFYTKLPASEHTVTSYDCHPLPSMISPFSL